MANYLYVNKMRKIDTICCVDSAYGLLLFFLITGKGIDNTFFLFSKNVPKIYREYLQKSGRLINSVEKQTLV